MNLRNPTLAYLVNNLIDTCRDEEETFRVASEEIRDAPTQSILAECARQRAEFSTELESLVAMETPASGQTIHTLGILHRSWIHFRIASAGDEQTILNECEQEEIEAEDEFRKVLKTKLPPEVVEVLERQVQEVRITRSRLNRLGQVSSSGSDVASRRDNSQLLVSSDSSAA